MDNLNFIDQDGRNQILEKYIIMALDSFHSKWIKVGGKYSFICNRCSENGHRKLRKAGLMISNRHHQWIVNCFRADCEYSGGVLAENWLKDLDSGLYKAYWREVFEVKKDKDKLEKIIKDAEKNKKLREIEEEKEFENAVKRDKEKIRNLVFITDKKDEFALFAMDYVKKRKIPNDTIQGLLANRNENDLRLVIPFYRKNKKPGKCQCRTLIKGREPRYLNMKFTKDPEDLIYNWDFVDKNKPVIIVEGPIDAMFIENGIATCSANIAQDMENLIENNIKVENQYYLFDNDDAGRNMSKKKMKLGKKVFSWAKFIKDMKEQNIIVDSCKDINDLYIKLNKNTRFKFNDFEKYFISDNLGFGLYL
jgi:hypothetical protein